MASTMSGGSNSDGSVPAPSGSGGIMDFLTTPVGMALAGGIALTLVAGYMVF